MLSGKFQLSTRRFLRICDNNFQTHEENTSNLQRDKCWVAYFDPIKIQLLLTFDANLTTFGDILSQQGDPGEIHILTYACKALGNSKTHYSQVKYKAPKFILRKSV